MLQPLLCLFRKGLQLMFRLHYLTQKYLILDDNDDDGDDDELFLQNG